MGQRPACAEPRWRHTSDDQEGRQFLEKSLLLREELSTAHTSDLGAVHPIGDGSKSRATAVYVRKRPVLASERDRLGCRLEGFSAASFAQAAYLHLLIVVQTASHTDAAIVYVAPRVSVRV